MRQLPYWYLTNPRPATYDSESGTVVEMTAKLYKAMQEMVEEHNNFSSTITEQLEKLKTETDLSTETFRTCIQNIVENHIKSVETKLHKQDLLIKEYGEFIHETAQRYVADEVKDVVEKMKQTGELDEILNLFMESINDTVTEHTNEIVKLTNNIVTLENTKPTYDYDWETEALTFQNISQK